MKNSHEVHRNNVLLKELLAVVATHVAKRDFEEAMQKLQEAGNFAWLNTCGQLAVQEIEDLILLLSQLLPDCENKSGDFARSEIVTILTCVHKAGGHSRLAWRWIEIDKYRAHHVILTNQGDVEIPDQLLELVDTRRIRLTRLDSEPTLWLRAARLRQILSDAEAAILFTHPDDPIAPVALAAMATEIPSIAVDHASHVFWMGLCAANTVVALHSQAFKTIISRRGVPAHHVAWVPITFDISLLQPSAPASLREDLKISSDAVVMMTSGWPYKFYDIEGTSFAASIAPVLAERPNTHILAIGPGPGDPAWGDLLHLFPERIHLLGIQDEKSMVAFYRMSDIYLDSIPFSSGTAVMEAAALGLPVLKYATQDMRDSGFSCDLDSIPLAAYNWTNIETYRKKLFDLIDLAPADRQELGALLRASVNNWHSEKAAIFFWDRAIQQAKDSPRIKIDASVIGERVESLDRLLIRLGENYRNWIGEKPEPKVRLLAFYLPQYHRIPENDGWWGKGFTEWDNVRKGKPIFAGHEQPKIPGDFGYYDLSDITILEKQARLARDHGIFGFCFYYYWFDGKRLLEKPVDALLQAKRINLPFCLCWANENWTKRWDGGDQEILIKQSYSPALNEKFASDLVPYFSDERYIRIHGKPVLLVYRPDIIPNIQETLHAWRTTWRNNGVGEVYLVSVESFRPIDPQANGFDASSEFPPHQVNFWDMTPDDPVNLINDPRANVGDYRKLSEYWAHRPQPPYKCFRALLPGWDNSARRRKGGATFFVNSNPKSYEAWLELSIRRTRREFVGDEQILFINAWNEWGEGCMLEPDERWGNAFLEATRRAVLRTSKEIASVNNIPLPPKKYTPARDAFATRPYPEHPLFPRFADSGPTSSVCVLISSQGNSGKLDLTFASIQSQVRAADQVAVFEDSEGLGRSLDEITTSWTLLAREGDVLAVDALLLLKHGISRNIGESVRVIYFDHDEVDGSGLVGNPAYKPDYNPDLLLSYPYMGRALLIRTDWLKANQGALSGPFDLADAYALTLKTALTFEAAGFFHLPSAIVHLDASEATVFCSNNETWQKLGGLLAAHLAVVAPGAQAASGPAPGTFHVLHPLSHSPLVSIIIPTRDQVTLLSRCIESIFEKTNYKNFEVLIVDNGSTESDTLAFLVGLEQLNSDQIRVLRVPGEFNFSRMNNQAVHQSNGEFILMLNNDTEALQADWLGHLMRHGLRDDVGAVGARLLYPNGLVQHAGVILGLRGPADHPCSGLKASDSGYMMRAQVQQNFSAVTAACMLVRKSVYVELGGLDEADFGVSFNDVDFCLRLTKSGKRIVWTPLATLLHEGSASQNSGIESASKENKLARFSGERALMYARWPQIIGNDPAYSPNLSLRDRGYEIEGNPLLRFDKLKGFTTHRVIAFAADSQGCGQYRVLQPLQSMLDAGLCTGGASNQLFSPNEALRSGADTLVLQRPDTDIGLTLLESMLALKNMTKVYEVDDHLAHVPFKNEAHKHIPKDQQARIARAIKMCDRLVVSTHALAHALAANSSDVRVIENRLPPAMWGHTPPIRANLDDLDQPRRPRIGWAGGMGHIGDLQMVADVIKEFSDKVDWVFFGAIPESILKHIHEYYPGVPTLLYPGRLMAQNWDLAIAPLESNEFNQYKSNLKLLEYGWCGIPVVCSDVTPYQCNLPATRVKNRFKDWRNAIAERIADLPACRAEGLALQGEVARNWTLTNERVEEWHSAWTGA